MPDALSFQFVKISANTQGKSTEAYDCAWDGCPEKGEYKAPLDHQDLTRVGWFCLRHIRLYNRAWNYYDGMSEAEVEADRRGDTVWQRATWSMNVGMDGKAARFHSHGPSFADPFSFFDGSGERENGRQKFQPEKLPNPKQQKAFKVFDLDVTTDAAVIKKRYKVLVKRHHPDANHGKPDSEDAIKRINEAYRHLLDFIALEA